MVNSQLPPEKFNVMGIRTLFEVGTAAPSIQKQVEAMLLAGSRVTQKGVRDMKGIKSKKAKGKKVAPRRGSLAYAKKRITDLEDENKQLRDALAKAKVKYTIKKVVTSKK